VTSFPEPKEDTIKREKSFLHWPHSSPSKKNMCTAGWSFNGMEGTDHTICMYCGCEYQNWQSEDDPRTIHEQLSSSCPFLGASCPMHSSLVPVKRLNEIYTPEKIAAEAVQPKSNIILISNSIYALPPKRHQSFDTFPGGPPANIEALVLSGFYYVGVSTLLQCYTCGVAFNDLHHHSSIEVNIRHLNRSPHCRLAQSLPQQNEVRSASKFYLYNIKR
jgi:hypothetical protein